MQSVSIDAARQDLTRARNDGVIGAAQTRDGVEQDNNIFAVFCQAFRLLNNHLCDLDVARGRLIKGRGDNLALHTALHIGHLFWTLINQKHKHITFGVIFLDGMGDILQQNRFTCPRRGDNQSPLAFSDWRDNINDAARLVFARRVFNFHLHALVRIKGREIIKVNLIARLLCG